MMTLYSGTTCPFSQRCRIVLAQPVGLHPCEEAAQRGDRGAGGLVGPLRVSDDPLLKVLCGGGERIKAR